jgi:hypothetical protein
MTTHSEICQELRFVQRQQSFHGLDFENQFPRDHDIRAEAGLQTFAAVNDRHWHLAPKFNRGLRQFKASTLHRRIPATRVRAADAQQSQIQ